MVCNNGFAQFPFPRYIKSELVALMHFGSGSGQHELQGFAFLREMMFGTVGQEVRSSDLKNMSSALSHHCIFILLFSLVRPLQFEQLVIDHFCSGKSSSRK